MKTATSKYKKRTYKSGSGLAITLRWVNIFTQIEAVDAKLRLGFHQIFVNVQV